jgi:arabinogalactan oligomer/maltooligosaccharide transport system substrate-binding protein
MKNRRLSLNLLSASLLAGLLLAAAGCEPSATPLPSVPPASPVPPPTATPPATTTVTVWHSWDSEEEGLIRNLLAGYQDEHPGVAVRLRQVSLEQILPEYQEAVLAGEGPDLLVGRSHWIGQLAEQQVIAPLDSLLDEEYWAEFYPFALEGVSDQGHRYGVPFAAETVALYYNRDFVAEPPTTTAALLSLAATWPGQEQAGLAFPLSFYNTVGYLYAFGGRLLDDQGQPALDTVEARAWLSWLQEVRSAPGVIATDSYGQADALFKGGSVAMLVNGSWVLPDYVRALGSERLGVAPLPMLDQTQAWPTPYVGYRVVMANPVRLADHPRETLDLLRFLGGPAVQQVLAGRLVAVPTWGKMDLSNAPLLAGFVREAELGRPRPVTPREQALWEPLDNLLRNVTSRRVPVDLALQETQQQIEQLLQEMAGGTP